MCSTHIVHRKSSSSSSKRGNTVRTASFWKTRLYAALFAIFKPKLKFEVSIYFTNGDVADERCSVVVRHVVPRVGVGDININVIKYNYGFISIIII